MNKEQLIRRIAELKAEAKPYAKQITETNNQDCYDECARQLSRFHQHISALELTLVVLDGELK